jgi:hypothetical protein
MMKKTHPRSWLRIVLAAVAIVAFGLSTKAQILGPLNPGFEAGASDWNAGGPGNSGGYDNFANPGTNGPSGPGTNCVLMSADGSVNPPSGNDLRCNYFSLGPAAAGSNAVSVDFDYNILNPFPSGDQVRIDVRFEDSNGNFLGEILFHVGTANNDVGGTGWHHFHGVAADPTLSAATMDIRISMNIFGDDLWSAGPVLFDNFLVQATPVIGVNDNGDFENTSVNWNAGGPGGTGGSEIFYNPGTNGPSAPGSNCVVMTADGSVNPPNGNDLRANNFYLGPATAGTNGVSVDFDYNIFNPFPNGDQIRVGLRFENSSGGFLGEHNFHLGTPNNDVGGTGWRHFHGVANDPTLAAVTADLRLSMNIFGDDIWSAGPVIFDNFVVKGTPQVGPNYNGDFEQGEANWNNGVNSMPGGFENFYYGPGTNGLSAPGTNCVLMSADGSITPPNGNDIRVNEFNVFGNSSLPVTISFDYNILNPIATANQIRVGLRFFDGNNNFVGEHNTYIGTPNGDLGNQGWKHLSATYPMISGAVASDIRVTMNIFGDDVWNNGAVLFDNFTVINGAVINPAATNVVMGTITNLPVTRVAVTGGSIVPVTLLEYDNVSTNLVVQPTAGIIESDGILAFPKVSYFGQPAHGTVTAKGPYLTYTPNIGYFGPDAFAFAIGDGLGGLATNSATVLVNKNAGLNKFSTPVNAGVGNYVLPFSGADLVGYILESAGSLNSPVVWTPVSTNFANGSGSVTFTNLQTGPMGFWRTQVLP